MANHGKKAAWSEASSISSEERANQIRTVLTEALSGIVGVRETESIFSPDGYGTEFIDKVSAAYESMSLPERISAAFPYIKIADKPCEPDVYESFPEVVWNIVYDPDAAIYSCTSEFSLEGYEDYTFEISVTKPELGGYYFVNKLSVCGADIYHKVYSEMAGKVVDDYPVIGESRFSDVLAQIQSEVDKTTNGRYDDSVLESFWTEKAEEEYNSIIELYGLGE